LELTLWIDVEVPTDADTVRRELAVHPLWLAAFNAAADHLTQNQMVTDEQLGKHVGFGVLFEREATFLLGHRVRWAAIRGSARCVPVPLTCPCVEAYAAPGEAPDAIVQRFDVGETSVIHDGRRASVVIDVSGLQLPPLTQFRFVKTASSSADDGTIDALELINPEKVLQVTRGPIRLIICPSAGFSPEQWQAAIQSRHG
jgi:hypothetical protein